MDRFLEIVNGIAVGGFLLFVLGVLAVGVALAFYERRL